MTGGMDLCSSADNGGYEMCRATTELSTFYTEVYAHKSHGIGQLIFTGSNLTFVTNANKTEETNPVANYHCNQTTTLLKLMGNITNIIDETHGKYLMTRIPIRKTPVL